MPHVSAKPLLIAGGTLRPDSLAGEVVIVTGAGGGIGLEAARSLLWLGATVVIAEIDEDMGHVAESRLSAERPGGHVWFVRTDVAGEDDIDRLIHAVNERFGRVDAVVNNACYAPFGKAVVETPIDVWDRSYQVNLRGPTLLARACLPGMITRRHGVFVCVSSTGGPYLAPYESLKAAQLALANALDAELTDTGVTAFTIGPGLVPTTTALAAIEQLAPRLGTTTEEFWHANRGAVVSVEAAGAGFAAAIALALRYAGQEISSSQALIDAGIEIPGEEPLPKSNPPAGADLSAAARTCDSVRATLTEQAAGWKQRSFFERQWMQRDFKQRVGMPVERCVEMLDDLERRLAAGDPAGLGAARASLEKLAAFYQHMGELARGYVKDPKVRDEQLQLIAGWTADVTHLMAA